MEERIKGLREANVLEEIHYLSLENQPADYILWEGPEDIPDLQNDEYVGESGTSHVEKHSGHKVINEVLAQVLLTVGTLGPQVHLVVTSPAHKYIIGMDISVVFRTPT